MTDVERTILQSSFIDTVRNLQFDEVEYRRLVDALEALAKEWAQKETVNKQIAAELFILPSVVRGSAQTLSGSDLGNRMGDAAEELETLVFQSLIPERL